MPRFPRFFVPRGTYHVHNTVARGEVVFDDPVAAAGFVKVLRDVRDLDDLTILGWCLMGSHYHLIVKTREVALWRSMARLQGTVSRRYNRRQGFKGRLWQSRYRARVIDDQHTLRRAIAYVHLQPEAVGRDEDPAGYPFSGHHEIVEDCRDALVHRAAVLRAFAADEQTGRQRYAEVLRSATDARWIGARVEELPWWNAAGHVDEIADPSRHDGARTSSGESAVRSRRSLELDELVRRFVKLTGCSLEDLASRLRNKELKDKRLELVTLALTRYDIRSRDLSRLLNKHGATVTRWLNAGLRRQRTDATFLGRLDSLDANILQADGGNHETQQLP